MTLKPIQDRAFTLVEVIVALAISAIVIGGVFGLAGSALDLASESNRSRLEAMRIHQLSRFLRGSFAELPPKCRVALNDGRVLTFLDAKTSFQWPGGGPTSNRTDLRFANEALEIAHYLGEEELSSLVLLEDLTSCQIEIQDATTRLWTSSVPSGAPVRPSLVKIRYQTAMDPMERVEVFRVHRFAQVNFTNQQNSQQDEPPAP
ncbi:MAG: hypothetical protein B9S36_01185 [Verrucomicrobiia bacterium Tous-C2TDCM]|nr:MAG: hypothetical protein B9S36_01185 [Verrucomicrobiae bacterium Tous-C2TDCM]